MGEGSVVILCAICWTPIFASYLIAAIVIGFIPNNNCMDQTDIIIDPFVYLKIGGFTSLALDLFTLCTRFTVCQKHSNQRDFSPSKGQSCVSLFGVLFAMVWIIIGSILYHNLDTKCAHSSVGNMVLSFIIISSVFNCIECMSISQSCITKNTIIK